jgi:hypothetical protein
MQERDRTGQFWLFTSIVILTCVHPLRDVVG